jgi:multidrug transporter EmrE-like cation transporter
MGGLFLVAVACMLRANRVWPPSAVWSAANMAFILPILLSALFMAEALHWLDAGILVGILLLLAGLADPAAPAATVAAESRSERRWLLLAAVFVTNGLLMFGFKAFGTLLPQVGSSCLVAVMYGCGALVALVLHAWRGSFRFTRAEAGWGAATGGATGAAVLLLLPSMSLPAAVAFPLIQGTSLVGGVLLCALLFRERLTLRKFGGLACGVIALVLAGMR